MACPGCRSERSAGERVVCCDGCGRVLLRGSEIEDLGSGEPPLGVRIVEPESPSGHADPYRSTATAAFQFEAELEHERRYFLVVLGFVLPFLGGVMIGGRIGLEMQVFFAIVGVAAIVVSLIPRRRRLRFAVVGDSMLVGRHGVPRSRWQVYDANAIAEVFVRAQTRNEEAARRYELVVAFEDGSTEILVAPLKVVGPAIWLALAIEEALGLEGSAMQASAP